MNTLRDMLPGIKFGGKVHPTEVLGGLGLGTGRDYYVMASSNTLYDAFRRDYNVKYDDGSNSVQNDIDTAVGLCTANRGDRIIVTPGHTESVIAAAGIDLDIAGISVIGLGSGSLRPTITFTTATTADIDIDAADITIENILFKCDIDALAAGIDVNAAGFTMNGCEAQIVGTDDALIWIMTDANADDMTIKNSVFRGSHAGPTECIRLVGADRANILDNYIIGSYSTAAINGVTTASTEILIARNTISNSVQDKLVIDLVASCTGRIELNNGDVVSAAALVDAAVIDAANCQLAENYFSDAVGQTGKLIGTVSAN